MSQCHYKNTLNKLCVSVRTYQKWKNTKTFGNWRGNMTPSPGSCSRQRWRFSLLAVTAVHVVVIIRIVMFLLRCSGFCLRVFRLVPGFQRNLFSHSPVPLNNWLYQSSSFDLPVSLILFFFFSVFDFLWPVMFSLHPQWERSLHMSLMIRETEYQTDLVINQWYVSYIGTT